MGVKVRVKNENDNFLDRIRINFMNWLKSEFDKIIEYTMSQPKFQQIKLGKQSRKSYTHLYTLKTEVEKSRIAVVYIALVRNT